MNPKMKEIEDKVRSVQEKEYKDNERINTLAPTECMMRILEIKHMYNEIEQIKAEQKIIMQKLESLQDEALKVIWELATLQDTTKK
jgi:hypothetical protein